MNESVVFYVGCRQRQREGRREAWVRKPLQTLVTALICAESNRLLSLQQSPGATQALPYGQGKISRDRNDKN